MPTLRGQQHSFSTNERVFLYIFMFISTQLKPQQWIQHDDDNGKAQIKLWNNRSSALSVLQKISQNIRLKNI